MKGFGSIRRTGVDAAGSIMGAPGTGADWAAICPLNHQQPLLSVILMRVLSYFPTPISASVFSTDPSSELLCYFSDALQ